VYHQRTDWRRYEEPEKGSTVFGSTINGESVSLGWKAMPLTLKSWTTTDGGGQSEQIGKYSPRRGASGGVREIGVPPRRINEIVHGKRSVTADTALRLARYFGTSEAFWMGLQADFDLEEARNRLGKRLETDVSVHAA
jgi:plasmid maintenance system antidote protein VapI